MPFSLTHSKFFNTRVNFRYLEGGVESGFNKVDPNAYIKRLFQVKGNKSLRIEQVCQIVLKLSINDIIIQRMY